MMTVLRFLTLAATLLWQIPAFAGAGTITTKDAAGTTRTFVVVTDGSGNFIGPAVICDQSAAATCASVGTAGSPSTNALTVQPVTIGNGTSANAARVTLSSDSTGVLAATQSGTWTVQPGNTANSTPWLVTATLSGASNAVNATLTAETTKVIGTVRTASGGVASGSFASGSIASGAIASGAVASGAYASGSIGSGAMVDLGAQADSVCATDTGTCSLIALVKKTNTNTSGAVPAGTNTIGTVGQLPYPVGATPITASQVGTTGATTATLAGTSGKTTYICGYSIRANATAAATVTNTITGVITATLSSLMWIAPLASGIGIDEQIFSPCIPASATNTGIAIVSGAPGSGGNVTSKGWGYQL